MNRRISLAFLEKQAFFVNEILETPREAWKDGKSCDGHVFVQSYNGRYRVCQMSGEHGGERNLCNLMTKRELAIWFRGYVDGIMKERYG